ncbi:MAG: class IV adenylate cyclase [Candidatus Pacebacteria bacterium]|nr:class IV adenylate cyclase [Candidatus Paceibacterota bacterium]
MALNDIEIEIQVSMSDTKPLVEFLEKSGESRGEKHQIDEYFTPAHRDFLAVRPAAEWLRLRDTDGRYSFNYKNWYFDGSGRSHHCDEYETKIEDLKSARKILMALNLKSLVVVDKIRKIWTYQDYEVALDRVKGAGDFVEIEYIGQDEFVDPAKVSEEMINFLKDFNCGPIKRHYGGYPFLLMFPNEVKWEVQ